MKAIHKTFSALFSLAVLTLVPLANYAQERIVFQTNRDGNQEIYSMKTDGSNPLRLTNNSTFDGEPSFGAAGSKVVFTSLRDGNAEIYIMNPDGTDQKRLTTSLGDDTHPALSPDGTKVAFISSRAGGLELFVMNADGTNPKQLTFTASSEFTPSFSPDGTKILYSGYDGNDPEVYVIDVDGSNNVNVTNNTKDDRNPSFSPDGTKIVYEVYDNANLNFDIGVMNADGTGQTNITNTIASYDTAPSYSPDGQHITYTSNGEVWLMTYGGDGAIAITDSGTNVANQNSTWSPANHAPVLEDVSVDTQVNEGGIAKVTGVIADEDSLDSHGITVDWGVGSPEFHLFPAGTTTFELTHTYVDDATVGTSSDDYTVLLALNDHRFGFDNVTKTVAVQNVAPQVSNLTINPSPVTVGKAFRLTGNFADPGYHGGVNDEALTVTIAFDDGQTNVSNTVAPGVIDIFHTYQTVGNHTVTVKVTDNDLGVTTQTINLVVAPPAPPAAPTNLRIDYIGANRVQLAWTDNSTNEDGFVVEQCSNRGCANFIQAGQTSGNTVTYTDSNLYANTQYYYRVRAFNLGGSSAYSNVVAAKTLKK
jgi:Tol biopolymer transport system component